MQPPPPKAETTTKCRVIRPKHAQVRKEKALSDNKTDSINTDKRDSREMSQSEVQKEILLSTLNPVVRKEKWVDYLLKGDTIFEVKDDGKT